MNILKYLALVLPLMAGAAEMPGHATAGVGLILGVKEHNIVVMGILPGSPAAAQGGIHERDRIMAIAQDQEPFVQVHGGELAQAVALIRGIKGTTVRLTIVPAGAADSGAQVVSFVRGELKQLSHLENGGPEMARPRRPRRAPYRWPAIVTGVALAGAGLFFLFRRKTAAS